MSDVQSGLEGVVAFATEIAEPDKEGSALRYRGVDIEELVGTVPFEQVWGLLVDGHLKPGLPPAEPQEARGPALLELEGATCWIPPGWVGVRDGISSTLRLTRVSRNGENSGT